MENPQNVSMSTQEPLNQRIAPIGIHQRASRLVCQKEPIACSPSRLRERVEPSSVIVVSFTLRLTGP